MARTAVTVNAFLPDSATSMADPAGTAIDQANGMNVALASGAFPAAQNTKGLLLRVANTAASPFTVTVRKGVGSAQGVMRTDAFGDLVVTVTNATTKWLGPFTASRFTQVDGSVNIDFQSGFTGTITAFLVPERTI